MTVSFDSPVSSPLEDPRSRADFVSEFFPKANGREAPPAGPTERNEQIMIAFLAAYYELNRAYDRLLVVRAEPESPDRARAERECLLSIEKQLVARDGLEDLYAPCGVVVEPIMKDGFAVDVRCAFGNVDAQGKPRSDFVTITGSVPVPLPPGAKLEDFLVRVELPDPYSS